MNRSPSFIGVIRPSLLGDCVASLPFITYLEKKYPNSYKCAYIDLKCSQFAPFLFNQPHLNEIRISDESDKFNDNDKAYFSQYDYQFEPYATPTDLEYFNKYHFCEAIFRMTTFIFPSGKARINPEEYNVLTEQEKKPYLHRWFPINRKKNTIAVWAKAGYANKDNSIDLRSPSNSWWEELCLSLSKMGYKLLLFGHPNSDYIKYTEDCRKLSLFDAIKESLACDLVISTDSGSGGWVIGAYGMRQIILYVTYKNGHITNPTAIVPLNYKNNSINIRGCPSINDINSETVLEAINNFN